MKTVKRTYYSKKLGKTVTKTYQYESSRYSYKKSKNTSPILVDRRGGVRRKAVNKVIQDIRDQVSNGTMSSDEAQYTIDEINYYVNEVRAGLRRQLRVSGLMGHLADTALDREFNNAGSSIDEEAAYFGITGDMLRANMEGNIFTDPRTGFVWQYVFGYEGFAQWVRLQ